MRNEIIGKLARLLNGRLTDSEIDEEMKVVYLLSQTRKVLEHERAGAAIKFYCNWALHIDLTNQDAQRFLKDIQPRLSWQGTNRDLCQAADRLLTLKAFRDELHSFLVRHSLNPDLCANEDRWNCFRAAYSRVVENCPLKVEAGTKTKAGAGAKRLDPIKTDINLKIKGEQLRAMEVILDSLHIESLPHDKPLSDDRPLPMRWVVNYRIKDTESVAKGSLSMSRNGVSRRTLSL